MGVSFNLREFLDIISVAIATASPPKRALLCPKLRVPPWHSWRHLPPLCLGTQSFSHRMDNAWKAADRSARRFLGLRLEPRRAHPGHLRIETHAVDIHQTHHWMNLNPSGIKHQPGAFCGLPSFNAAALPGHHLNEAPAPLPRWSPLRASRGLCARWLRWLCLLRCIFCEAIPQRQTCESKGNPGHPHWRPKTM